MYARLLAAGLFLMSACLAERVCSASPLDIPPAPIIWTMPREEAYDTGRAEFLASPELRLCLTCSVCDFESLAVSFSMPWVDGCTKDTGGQIEMRRLESIHLENIGSTATIPVLLPQVYFQNGVLFSRSLILPCINRNRGASVSLLSSMGSMTIQRTSETGGYFSLQFTVSLEASMTRADQPNYIFATRLGPYYAELESIPWSWQAATSPQCQSCTGDFRVVVDGDTREPFFLQGLGTTPYGYLHLDRSQFTLPLRPVCSLPVTAIHKTSWGAIKEMMR